MELPGEIRIPVKRRRYSPQFKAQVIEEAMQDGISVAAVARRHNLNANLIHKWLKTAQGGVPAAPAAAAFISLPAPPTPSRSSPAEARIEIPGARGVINLFWPCDQSQSLAEFLKTLS
jgi:transposase